jgi:hypothetical protein
MLRILRFLPKSNQNLRSFSTNLELLDSAAPCGIRQNYEGFVEYVRCNLRCCSPTSCWLMMDSQIFRLIKELHCFHIITNPKRDRLAKLALFFVNDGYRVDINAIRACGCKILVAYWPAAWEVPCRTFHSVSLFLTLGIIWYTEPGLTGVACA